MLDPSDFLEIIDDNDSSNFSTHQQSFSRKRSPEFQNSPPPSKNSVEAYRSYILENSTTHVVDNVKIYVKKPTSVGFKGEIHNFFVKSQKYSVIWFDEFSYLFSGLPVHLDCPCCNNLETYINIGYHLNNLHSATHISCPGKKCGSNLEIPSLAFTDHLMKNHMKINCPTCHKSIGNFDWTIFKSFWWKNWFCLMEKSNGQFGKKKHYSQYRNCGKKSIA